MVVSRSVGFKGFSDNSLEIFSSKLKSYFYVLQSDDSLDHLSAEEKACLMFLEETIESLDTEEDSGLSNDESDQLPNPGNLATKLADLSASMSKSKLNGELISGYRCRITAVNEMHCISFDTHMLL